MKFSKITGLAAISSVALAAPAVITVTEHAHSAKITVRGVVYFENGTPVTSYTTIDTNAPQATNISTAAAALIQQNEVEATTTSHVGTATTAATDAVAFSAVQENVAANTVAAASTSAAKSDSSLSDFANTILKEHNIKRALQEDTSALTWSSELATYAQNYADSYDCSGTLTHSGGPYGENLALGYTAAGSVDAWYNEIQYYDFSNPTFSSQTGHFTQVVWKSSTQVGCGIKACNNEWGNYVICSYNPAGNYIGEFAENVGSLL